jgi:hypothetical protein
LGVTKNLKPPKPITSKQRESDEKLRDLLRNADMKQFDKALEKAIRPADIKEKEDAD